MRTSIPMLAALVLIAPASASPAAFAPAHAAALLAQDSADTADSLGLSLTDPVVHDAMNLFNADKVDDAIALIDRTVKERIQG